MVNWHNLTKNINKIDEFIKKYGVEVSNEDSKIIECIKEFAGI